MSRIVKSSFLILCLGLFFVSIAGPVLTAGTQPTVAGLPDVAVAPDGTIFVAGVFRGTVDFDPGPGLDERTARATFDVFVTAYDRDGSYRWTRTFPSGTTDLSAARVRIAADGSLTVEQKVSGKTSGSRPL